MSLDRFTRPQQTFLRRMFYKIFQTVSLRRPVSIQMAARRWEQMFSNKKVSFTVNGGRWTGVGESLTVNQRLTLLRFTASARQMTMLLALERWLDLNSHSDVSEVSRHSNVCIGLRLKVWNSKLLILPIPQNGGRNERRESEESSLKIYSNFESQREQG